MHSPICRVQILLRGPWSYHGVLPNFPVAKTQTNAANVAVTGPQSRFKSSNEPRSSIFALHLTLSPGDQCCLLKQLLKIFLTECRFASLAEGSRPR